MAAASFFLLGASSGKALRLTEDVGLLHAKETFKNAYLRRQMQVGVRLSPCMRKPPKKRKSPDAQVSSSR